MALRAKVTYDKLTDSYDVEFSFNKWGGDYDVLQTLIKIFKSTIAVAHREYNPNTKHWSFLASAFTEIVKPLFKGMHVPYTIEQPNDTKTVGPENFFYEHAVAGGQITETPAILGAKLIKLLEIPEETLQDSIALKKVYRQKARQFHPDLGGDAAKMSELNRLWTLFNSSSV